VKKIRKRKTRPAPSAPPVTKAARGKRRREWLPSLIWLIPIVAALVGVTLVARLLMERGPEIVLTFKTAEGLEAGKTAVKYKDVQIGLVHAACALRAIVRTFACSCSSTRTPRASPRRTRVSGWCGHASTLRASRAWARLLSGAYIGADAGTVEGDRRRIHRASRRRPSSRATIRASSFCCARRHRLARRGLAGLLPAHQGRPGGRLSNSMAMAAA
jgi:hypothetical protein